MTRIDEQHESQRADEQRRLEETAREKKVADREQFSRVMSQKTAQSQDVARQAQDAAAKNATQQGSAQQALLARHGILSSGFARELQKQGEQLVADNRAHQTTQNKDVSDGKKVEREVEGEHHAKVDRQADQREGRLAAISRDERRKGSGDQGSEGGASGDGHPGAGTQGGGGLAGGVEAGAGTTGASGTAGAPRLPAAVLQQLVDRVLVGVNAEGLQEFQVEFKESVLAGARLVVNLREANVIGVRFESDNANVRRLVYASRGELAAAFEKKGLVLALEVPGA